MSDAPARIWADHVNLTWVEEHPDEVKKSCESEYVRADLYEARSEDVLNLGFKINSLERENDALRMALQQQLSLNVSDLEVLESPLKDRAEKAEAEVTRLRALVDGAAAIFSNCTVEHGHCCCGDSMENHSSPMMCGHTPVDQGQYQASLWMDEYDAMQDREGNDRCNIIMTHSIRPS